MVPSQRQVRVFATLCVALLGLVSAATAAETTVADLPAEAPEARTEELRVPETFNGKPFAYRMRLLSTRPGYRIYRLTYPSPVVTDVLPNNTVPADYYLPEGATAGSPPRPAVICLHILEGNFELVHMTCAVLASRGIPAMMFKLPYYGERSPPEGRKPLTTNPRRFVEAVSQALQDVRRTVDLLASRPEVDPQRIGITGISLGGIVAATAAAEDPRIARAALILAGGELNRIIHHARETEALSSMIRRLPAREQAALSQQIDAVDPLRLAPRLRDRAEAGKVLMINAAEDRVIPRTCTEKLAAALGLSDRVVWLEGLGHYTALAALPQALQQTADFFAQDMPAGATPPPESRAVESPARRVAALLAELGKLLASEPKSGRCHLVDLEAEATLSDGRQQELQLRLIRGPQYRFRLQVDLPGMVAATLGQGSYPWIASGEKVVFAGTLADEASPGNPLAFAEQRHLLRLKMASGALLALALAPEMLENWVEIAAETTPDGPPAVRIAEKRRPEERLRLVFGHDGKSPRLLEFQLRGMRGTVNFRAWQLEGIAQDALFEPPAAETTQRVDAEDLYRILSAMFNFALENMP